MKGPSAFQENSTRYHQFRSLRRFRWLKKAIKILIATGEVTLEDLTPDEWLVFHKIDIVLETIDHWKRILEGEKCVTGSLAAVSVLQMRKVHEDVIECEDVKDTAKNLTKILLKDFDKRYQLAEGGKVKHFREETLGRG